MITIRDYFVLVPVWKIAKTVHIKYNNAWTPVQQVWVKSGANFNKVYNQNVAPAAGNPHQYWKHTLDPEFVVLDNVSSGGDGLASDLFFTFWSTANGGTYSIGTGSLRININNIDTTYVPPTAGYYVNSTESKQLFCNFTSGSRNVVTFNTADLNPYSRTGADGNEYAWSITAAGYVPAGTNVNRLNNPIDAFNFTINAQATATGTGVVASFSRTYPSSYVPPTSAYYSHGGYCRAISNYELAVSGGQTYRISVGPVNTGDIGTKASWGMNAYTSSTAGQAVPFGTNSTAFESSTYSNATARTFDVTIPSGHTWFRPGIFISHNSTTSTNSPPATPIWCRFDYLRVERV